MTTNKNQDTDNGNDENWVSKDELEDRLRRMPQFEVPEQLLANLLNGIDPVSTEPVTPVSATPVLATSGGGQSNWQWRLCIGVAASLLIVVAAWIALPGTDDGTTGKAVSGMGQIETEQPNEESRFPGATQGDTTSFDSLALLRETDPCNILPPFSN